ncbi:MAG: phosphate/phosphite/phosphonate ABC transporter substrate-binding protein [Thermodesulfobacteriota bacterium]|nr:phosphate/phosphite/phosphonate ABC transporter substrate-binding protein [Thermodesulfobacteriota bacterium]
MKIMLRLILYLVGLSVLCSICHADNRRENDTDIVRKNDEIIRTVHESGGIVMAVPPYWGREPTWIGFEQLAKHLGSVLKKEVALVILKDHQSMITRTKAGDVDIGVYGASLYVRTKKICPRLRYIATSIWKKTGKYTFFAYLITRKGSGLLSIESLSGKSFAFGSKESTGGYKYPRAWMKENGIDPEKYFSNVRFLGSHNNVLDAVAKGGVDAGAVSPGPLAKAEKRYGKVFNRIRKFGPIPGTVIAVKDNLPEESIGKIAAVLTSLPDEVTEVEDLDFIGFKVLSDEAYDQLRKVIEVARSVEKK